MENESIDWDGNCIFENGKIVGFRIPSQNNHFHMRPIPQTEEAIRDAREAYQRICEAMRPATHEEIAIMVKRLSLHCGMQHRSPEDVRELFMDYCHDLEDYPKSLLEEACAAFRKDPEVKFLPSTGQFIQKMESGLRRLKKYQDRLGKMIKNSC